MHSHERLLVIKTLHYTLVTVLIVSPRMHVVMPLL